jgi:hypothetical protein
MNKSMKLVQGRAALALVLKECGNKADLVCKFVCELAKAVPLWFLLDIKRTKRGDKILSKHLQLLNFLPSYEIRAAIKTHYHGVATSFRV